MALSIQVDDTKVRKKMNTMIKNMDDFRKPLEESGNELMGLFGDKVFREQGATGEKWRNLSAATLKMRSERTGYYKQSPKATGQILVWTGRLQAGFKKTVDRFTLTIENTVDYFKYHQRRGGRPAQRRMLFVNKDVIELVFNNLIKHVKNAIK